MTSALGERLREQRLRRGLTQFELARKLNPNATSGLVISKWENGRSHPSAEGLRRLQAAGLNVNFILKGLDDVAQVD